MMCAVCLSFLPIKMLILDTGASVCRLWIVLIIAIENCVCSNYIRLVKSSSLAPSTRIVGGKQADIQNYPYQLSMQYRNNHVCGASILSPKFVITAAHCLYNLFTTQITFRGGSSLRSQGGQVVTAKRVQSHPKFNFQTVDFDVALVEVTPTFRYNEKLNHIAIASSEPRAGSTTITSGWGTVKEGIKRIPSQLRAVEIPVVARPICKIAYSNRAVITERMICAGYVIQGGKDTCQGDSGGPLVSNGKLVGIVSWGFGCARRKYPGV